MRGSYTTYPMNTLVCISSHQRRQAPRSITVIVVQVVFTACRGRAQPQHAWEATGRDGSDRWQLGVAEIVKGFPSLVLRGGDTIPVDFICSSSLLLGFRDPWVRHKGGA